MMEHHHEDDDGAPPTDRWSFWHAVATGSISLVLIVGGYIVSGWHAEFAMMQQEQKEMRAEQVRQAGVDLSQRQQIDINTGRLSKLWDEHAEVRVDLERIKTAQEFWMREYKWKDPNTRRTP